MDHCQVAINTDTAQETNADVDILIEQEATELTQPFLVTPVITLKHIHAHQVLYQEHCTNIGWRPPLLSKQLLFFMAWHSANQICNRTNHCFSLPERCTEATMVRMLGITDQTQSGSVNKLPAHSSASAVE